MTCPELRNSASALRSVLVIGFVALVVVLGACKSPELPRAASLAGPPTVAPTVTPEPELSTPTPTPVPTPDPSATLGDDAPLAPTATPIPVPGLTQTSMRLGVIADLDSSGVADDLSLGAWQGAQAWAAEVNSKGGIAGRTVELLLSDSRVLFHADAVEWACSNDIFALVGSKAIQDGDGVELLVSNACSLPDFPADALMSERRDSAVTFMSNPYPQPFYQAGPLAWMAEEFPDALADSATFASPLSGLRLESERMREAAGSLGYNFGFAPLIGLDDDFVEAVAGLEEAESRSLVWTADPDALLDLLRAKTQSSSPPFDFILCNADCYGTDFLESSGGLAEGVSAWIPHLPFSEPSQSPELVSYLFALAGNVPDARPSAQGVAAWSAGRLFEEAVGRAVGAGTPDYDPAVLTREGVLAAAGTIDIWTANGIYNVFNPPNPSAGVPSPCFVLMRVENGAWVRQHPIAAGTMDCNPLNRASLFSNAASGAAQSKTVEPDGSESIATDPPESDEPVG